METETKLEIGKRYWLDSVKDVSGICTSNEDGNLLFNEIEGKCIYLTRAEGTVMFSRNTKFTLV